MLCSPAWALSPAGSAVDVVPQAQGAIEGSTVMLARGDAIFIGQKVITGNAGRVQVVFSDDTHLVIGPGSTLVISEYLMRNDGSASKFVVDALGGTFRFVTGKSPKNAYAINTPTGTMGVRGTAFDFGVDPESGETQVLLYHGGVQMCGEDGSCAMLSEGCSVGVLADKTSPSIVNRSDRRRNPLLQKFPYLESQQPLQFGFRIMGAARCGAPKEAGTPTASSTVAGNAADIVTTTTASTPTPQQDSPAPSQQPAPAPSGHNNNGIGNGGDTSSEGTSEATNPGRNKK
jgi:hypothetical protein